MTKTTVLASAAVAAALVAGLSTTAVGRDGNQDGDHGKSQLRADLKGFNEVATVSSAAHGSFQATLSADETSIDYHLQFSGLEGTVTQSHIHLGAVHTSGGISVWLCQTATNPSPSATTPDCGGPSSGDVMGTLTAAEVIGPTGQGIAAGEFAEVVRAIKAGVTYANVHSTKFPGGEIRGQIRAGH